MTFRPTEEFDSDYNDCQLDSQELAWNGTSFSGTVAGHDLMYYFERIGGDCYFKLRSNSLGYPAGYEHQWLMSGPYAEVSCAALATSISVSQSYSDECSAGVIETACAVKIMPALCSGCNCTCQCICITYADPGAFCTKSEKACWDEYEQGYRTTIRCGGGYPVDVLVRLEPANEYDDTCRAVLYFDGQEYEPKELTCPDFGAVWDVDSVAAGSYATVTIRCAECEEICNRRACCPSLPDTLYLTVSTPCVTGVLTLYLSDPILPSDAIVWETIDPQPLSVCTCELISGLDNCVNNMFNAFVTCVPASGGSPAYLSVTIDDGVGGVGFNFAAHFIGCHGGVKSPSSSGVITYNFGTACCGSGGVQGGTVTLSA